MTLTALDEVQEQRGGPSGRVARITGPVVDIEFPADGIPEQYNLLTTQVEIGGEKKALNLEVAQHIGDNMVRAISLQPTDGLVRGTQHQDTGGPLSGPVSDPTLAKAFTTTGEVMHLAEATTYAAKQHWCFQRKDLSFDKM